MNNKKTDKNASSKVQNSVTIPNTKRKTKARPKSLSISNKIISNDKQNNLAADSKLSPIIPTDIVDERPDLKKMGRSNSFFLTRKLSKLINTITNSRENLPEPRDEKKETSSAPPPSNAEIPFKFTRSRSMITLRKSSKRIVLEAPQLEQLSEESENAKSPIERNRPQSIGIFDALRRRLSNASEKKRPVNPRWSASLLNLQEIDNMVSYEDLSFVNYDKFNNYERYLEKRISQQDLTAPLSVTVPTTPVTPITPITPAIPTISAPFSAVVVRRRKRTEPRKYLGNSGSVLDIDGNFDKRKNLYRQSIEGEKLKHMNDVQRDSFRWSQCDEVDSGQFKYFGKGKRKPNWRRVSFDELVLMRKAKPTKSDDGKQLKSKSLTDLDILDSITCQQGTAIEGQKPRVSSSEYFSVSFCTDSERLDEELIPAIKGLTLFEALSPSLRKRNLSFSQIAICDNSFQSYNESTNNSPPYTSSLDESTDVENLAGRHLIVIDRDVSKRTGQLQKAASFGARTRPPRLLSSASTEESTEAEQKIIPGKQLKQRWSGLFGMKNQQQSQLCELLNDYAKKGVPQKTSSLNFNQPQLYNALDYLGKIHKSWHDFVQRNEMSECDIKIQSAIWELVTTEVDYIHALKTVTDLFLACLEGIQEKNLLTDVDQNKLFSNIYDIYEANFQFWSHYLYPMVERSIATSSPMSIDFFQEGFINFALTFAPYKKYCAEQSTCQFYCKELNRNNPLFTSYLAWCESQKMCNRLRLADILVRPMQRLTKYSLLLLAIRKHISDENDGDNMDAMIHSVENFVCSVNTHLTTRQENERLKGIMARIESYDVVDSNNEHLDKFTKQYSVMFDLCSPMKGCPGSVQGRHLFMEGDLKFKDSIGKADVHCFLLTDILLICKTIAKKGQGTLKVIRQPYMTDRLVVKQKDNILYCVYLNEFQMAVTAFTLQCTEAKSWHDAMTKAKHIYSRLKQGSNWEGYNLRHTNSGSINNADTLSIKKSPLNSSIGSRVSSLNNSHSGSVELNDSRNISVDFEKTNSLSSDEGSFMSCSQSVATKPKTLLANPQKMKTSSSNQLAVQPHNNLGQSLPNLNLHPSHTSNLYHTYSNNTLLVPGSSHSGYVLLSPCHRGISYPPPSPTRVLRRGFAFSSSIKNPPLVKTRNITSQNSFNFLPTTTQQTQQQQQQPQLHQQQPQSQQQQPLPQQPLPQQHQPPLQQQQQPLPHQHQPPLQQQQSLPQHQQPLPQLQQQLQSQQIMAGSLQQQQQMFQNLNSNLQISSESDV